MSSDGPDEAPKDLSKEALADDFLSGDVRDEDSDFHSNDAPSWFGETLDSDSSNPQGIGRFQSVLESDAPDNILEMSNIGNYRPIELIGRGGMGAVYRAESTDGHVVALKVLRPELLVRPEAKRRFQKEAQLLSEVQSPAITALYKTGEDQGITYLAMEFVDGITLGELLRQYGQLSEQNAMAVIGPIAKGLASLHPKGIVHRDIKPANILIAKDAIKTVNDEPVFQLNDDSIKLTDFGLARHIDQPESMEMTQTHAVLGTPQYLAPEQFSSGHDVQPTVDVYALGATLFEMISGKPAIVADSFVEVIDRHRQWTPPLLCEVDSGVSRAISEVAAKAMEKNPLDRYADAGEMLADLANLEIGRPSAIRMHPILPDHDSAEVRTYELVCELKSSPQVLWPYVSNTERVNRAVDLPAVDFSIKKAPNGEVQQFGSVKFLGMDMQWREHPFEWVESTSMSVLRQLNRGPFEWITSNVQLKENASGGTTLTHRFYVKPRGALGGMIAAFQVGRRSLKAFERLYTRIDNVVYNAAPVRSADSSSPSTSSPSTSSPSTSSAQTLPGQTNQQSTAVRNDAFEQNHQLNSQQQKRLDELTGQLSDTPVNHDALLHLIEFVSRSAPQAAARMQPIELARRWGVARKELITLFLHATKCGLLQFSWDIHCPICRVPSDSVDNLSDVKTNGRCQVCDVDFGNDLSHSVEIVFRVNREIRDVDRKAYCVGGPWHLPHVVVQCRLEENERHAMSLGLCEGEYMIRSPQLATALPLSVSPNENSQIAVLELSEQLATHAPINLACDGQRLTLVNHFPREMIVRIERIAQNQEILSAAEIAAHPLFAKLFPEEVISADAPVEIEQVSFLVNRLHAVEQRADASTLASAKTGDSEIEHYALVQQYLADFRGKISASGGRCFKVIGETAIAVFHDDVLANRAAETIASITPAGYRNHVTVNQGPAILATVDGRLEYFGATLNDAMAGSMSPAKQ